MTSLVGKVSPIKEMRFHRRPARSLYLASSPIPPLFTVSASTAMFHRLYSSASHPPFTLRRPYFLIRLFSRPAFHFADEKAAGGIKYPR